MHPTGLHFLLTYRCAYRCPHCFVWAGPRGRGPAPRRTISDWIAQARELSGLEWLYFEGGEPFLHPSRLRHAVETAAEAGFQVGIVSNGFWATDRERAEAVLRPFAGKVADLTLSSDAYHGSSMAANRVELAKEAARHYRIPVAVLSIADPVATARATAVSDLRGCWPVVHRGRAAACLAKEQATHPPDRFDRCPHEKLGRPDRVHVDPFGWVSVCQGIAIGHAGRRPLAEIWARYEPALHPVIGPLLQGGPIALARTLEASDPDAADRLLGARYADACHLCYEARRALRGQHPRLLAPAIVYGEGAEPTWTIPPSRRSRSGFGGSDPAV